MSIMNRIELLDDRATYLARASGALIGLGVGDAVGDLGRSQEHRALYGLITRLLPEGKSTDDTEFGFLTARALIDAGGEITAHRVAESWRRYIIDNGGMKKRGGRPLYGAVRNIGMGIMPPHSGTDNTLNDDDGAAMRMAPIGIFAAGSPREAARLAAIDASVSHARDGIWAAQAVAVATAIALTGAPPEHVTATARTVIPSDSWLARSWDRAMALCDGATSIRKIWEDLHVRFRAAEHSASAEAIPQAFALYRMTGTSLDDALFWSANFGRDADTICAIVCSLVGAGQGLRVFPDEWIAQVRRADGVCLAFVEREDALVLAEELVDLAIKTG